MAVPTGAHPPEPGAVALSFLIDPGGIVLGVERLPFRLLLASPPPDDTSPPTLHGELDFSGVSGTSGPLHLSGVGAWTVDAAGVRTGGMFELAPFTIQ